MSRPRRTPSYRTDYGAQWSESKYGRVCPRCRQNAPLIYRGMNAFCTACGAPRMPLASSSLNLAGQPSKVGGTVARVFGWIVLLGGLLLGFGTLAACGALVGFASAAPYLFGIPITLVSVLAGYFLLKSGKEMSDAGAQTAKATQLQALFALANARGGVLTPLDVARAHNLSLENADNLLTTLAKENPDHVAVDIDDNGNLLYRFVDAFRARVDVVPNTRVASSADVNAPVEESELLDDERSSKWRRRGG
ncbi:MAG: hypothetical protein FWD69_12630 [Polyangiaceae bacterium]|nr:hypothetical protein [Polyangiaceae bacterium]